MGKRYYCDYCERSFADGAENRKKHLASMHHQKLRKAHYDMFKDAETMLLEDRTKKPCRKFHQNGHCEFGSGCIYSHLTAADIQKLQEQVRQEKSSAISKSCPKVDLDEWLKERLAKQKQISSDLKSSNRPVLPNVLYNIPNLPPSLIPSKPLEILQKTNQWG